ncbi:MAG: outer membrane protein assembly factor BamB family protein [Limisphaerales bacterium]
MTIETIARRFYRVGLVALLWASVAPSTFAAENNDGTPPKGAKGGNAPLTVIVLDPLSRELACACVKGFGQRDYRKVSTRLAAELKERVSIEFSDDLVDTLQLIGNAHGEYLVIGDRSLTAANARKAGLKFEPLCDLSDREGATDLSAVFVVRSDDPAKELKEIAGRKLLVGLPQGDERLVAALSALRAEKIEVPEPEKQSNFNDAALDLLDSEASPLPVAVLPAYALPLLQGCGSVKLGNLKIIGRSPPTPFITVFASQNISAERREKIKNILLAMGTDPLLLEALESKEGFKIIAAEKPKPTAHTNWPDWRGPRRDGRVAALPAKLSSTPKMIWKKAAVNGAVAGLSVSNDRLLVAERDPADEKDVYRCFDAKSGENIWRMSFPAKGNLDYGNAPRAAPVIQGDRAYLLGAFGDLRCVEMADGKVVWQRQLTQEFSARLPTWGMCAPPLIVDDMLVVNPGGSNASIAALDLATGATRWTTPGAPAAYGAFIRGKFGGRDQIIGYDHGSLGGWDPKSGKRLWQVVPPIQGDFNVPTPIMLNGELLVSTENNGTRSYAFDSAGQIIATPKARFKDLCPDTATPVVTNARLFGVSKERIYCLDAKTLEQIWMLDEEGLGDHASLLADDQRVLVFTIRGEIILIDAEANHSPVISRVNLFSEEVEVYAHPALVGTRLFARGSDSVLCVDLGFN